MHANSSSKLDNVRSIELAPTGKSKSHALEEEFPNKMLLQWIGETDTPFGGFIDPKTLAASILSKILFGTVGYGSYLWP